MKQLFSTLVVTLLMFCGCAAKIEHVHLKNLSEIDLVGKWNFKYEGFYSYAVKRYSGKGTIEIENNNNKLTGKAITPSMKYGDVITDLAISVSGNGTILLKGSNARSRNGKTLGNWKPDSYEIFYNNNPSEMILIQTDDYGNRAKGTLIKIK